MEHIKSEQEIARQTLAITFCQAFWITRLMVLAHLKEKFNMDPTSWIYWVNDGGQQIIVDFQVLVMERL
jgi:hypothetical protein